MSRIRHAVVAAAAAMLLVAAPALAADNAPDAHKLALAKRFFAAMHMDQMMGGVMRQMMPAMEQAMAKQSNGAALTAEQRRAISEATSESMQAMMARMTDLMAPAYAETFSERELQDLVTFYEGPTAQHMLAKTPELTARMLPELMKLMPEMQQDVQRRLCSKLDCTKLAQPPAKSGA